MTHITGSEIDEFIFKLPNKHEYQYIYGPNIASDHGEPGEGEDR